MHTGRFQKCADFNRTKNENLNSNLICNFIEFDVFNLDDSYWVFLSDDASTNRRLDGMSNPNKEPHQYQFRFKVSQDHEVKSIFCKSQNKFFFSKTSKLCL